MFNNSVALCVLITILALGYAYDDCGSKLGEPIHIAVSGCPDPEARCVLVRNKKATLTIEFKTKVPINNVTNVVHGIVLGVPVPFALPDANACVSGALKCPLDAGETYKFDITLPVERKYPRVTVDVKWQMQNENNEDIICSIIPAKIQ